MQHTEHFKKPIPPVLKRFFKIIFLATGLVYTFYELHLFVRDIQEHLKLRDPR